VLLEQGPVAERLQREGQPFEVIEAGRLRNVRALATTQRWLKRQIDEFRPHAVYSNMPKAHVYCSLPSWRARLPALWSQMMIPSRPDAIERLATVLPARRVIALSEAGAEAQRRLAFTPPVDVIHPGLELNRFRPGEAGDLRAASGIPPDAPLVGIVGRLQPWKGQDRFLHAARIVSDQVPEARFAVIGGAVLGWEGDYPERLRRLAADLGLTDRVVFTGHTPDALRWTDALDVAVNASDPEPFGLVILEAMALGTPVVAVGRGGPAEILTPGSTGLLSADSTPEALAGPVLQLLQNPDLRREIGRNARREIETRFTADRQGAAFAATVRSCVTG
jgi:glycosyltransferase involved in cell wall biosynthesis